MKRFLILALTVIMLVSALCVPSFAVTSELLYVPAESSTEHNHVTSSSSTSFVGGLLPEMPIPDSCEHNLGMDYYADDAASYEYNYCINGCGYSEEPYSTVPHTYLDGVCSTCGHECTHSSVDENGDCIFCTPKECTEHSFIGTVCDNCGYVCTHSSVEEGTCPDCGFYVAPSECTHELFNFQTGLCELCGALVSEPNDGLVDQPTFPDEDSPVPDTPKPSTPSTSEPSASDEEGLDFAGFIGILGGAFAIFIVIYAWSAIKPKKR